MLGIAKGLLISLLVIAYPVIIYYLLTHNLPWIGVVFVTGVILWKLRNKEYPLVWLSGFLISVALIGYLFGPEFISKIVPLLIHLTLFMVFFQSLKTTPLITQFARLDFPELPDGIAEYCRSLTILWTGFFASNIVFCLWLAVNENDKLWALYNGLIVYLLIATLIVGEYIWRKIKFPGLEVPTLRQSVQNIIQKGPQIWNPDPSHAGKPRQD